MLKTRAPASALWGVARHSQTRKNRDMQIRFSISIEMHASVCGGWGGVVIFVVMSSIMKLHLLNIVDSE